MCVVQLSSNQLDVICTSDYARIQSRTTSVRIKSIENWRSQTTHCHTKYSQCCPQNDTEAIKFY